MKKIKWILWLCLVLLLFYTRFVNLSWGLPYPFHPDERNIADAIIRLTSEDFFKPTFYAYGQFSIYAAYILSVISNITRFKPPTPVGFEDAILSLRLLSALASLGVVYYGFKIVHLFHRDYHLSPITYLLLTFSPALIQFAHFGTTESLLMFWYTAMVYYCLRMINHPGKSLKYLLLCGTLVGLAGATKISGIAFALVPVLSYTICHKPFRFVNIRKLVIGWILFSLITLFTLFLFSPYNFLAAEQFLGSMRYESEVALGQAIVFYTRQFLYSVPFLFQIKYIFPYALGMPVFVLFILAFFLLPYNDKRYNILRAAFLLFFLPNAFYYSKWTRFLAPVFPLMIIFGCLGLLWIFEKVKNISQSKTQNYLRFFFLFSFFIFIFACILPGVAYLSVYQNSDVRFKASEWIYKNIPDGSYILSETANVVDIPIESPTNNVTMKQFNNLTYISFNFFDVDKDPKLQVELAQHIKNADYIFVMSRRVYTNHTCIGYQRSDIGYQKERCKKLEEQYPILNDYYRKLFSRDLGFIKVAEFDSYPTLEIGKWKWEIRDELSEETWTVFDHPVIRIYKKA